MSVYSGLPDEIIQTLTGGHGIPEEDREKVYSNLIKRLLNLTDEEYALHNQRFHILLCKLPDKKWKKPPRHTKKKLSLKERRKLGLYSLGRKSLKYDDLLPIHSLWKDYIKKYINYKQLRFIRESEPSKSLETLGVKLYRADFHGAEFYVKRSVCPDHVGKSGIVAMETRNCFMIVGKDNITRTIPKATSEFSFEVDDFKFSFFGKNLLSRPAERSSKKIKTIYPPEL